MGKKIETVAEATTFFKMHSRANKQIINGKVETVIVSDAGDIHINHPDPFTLQKNTGDIKLFLVTPVGKEKEVYVEKKPDAPAASPDPKK